MRFEMYVLSRLPSCRGWALCGLLLLLLGCASTGESSRVDSTPGTLTRAELLETNEATLYEAIQRLRPQWLRSRGGSLSGPSPTQVFLDGSPRGEVSVLREIRIMDVAEVRFLSATDAATLYGTLAGIGRVIQVRSGN